MRHLVANTQYFNNINDRDQPCKLWLIVFLNNDNKTLFNLWSARCNFYGGKSEFVICSGACVYLQLQYACVCVAAQSFVCVCHIVDIAAVWYHLSCCHNNRSCSWWWCIVCQTISARTWSAGPMRLQTWFSFYGGCLLSPLELPLDRCPVSFRRPLPHVVLTLRC